MISDEHPLPISNGLAWPACLERQIAYGREQENKEKSTVHGTQVRIVTRNAHLASERHTLQRATHSLVFNLWTRLLRVRKWAMF
jgi:hypothetical protein